MAGIQDLTNALVTFDNKNLFDKIINVTLRVKQADALGAPIVGIPTSLPVPSFLGDSVVIQCPDTGPKPSISIKGNFILSPVVTDLQLRITNLTLPRPLSEYGSVEITAGYRGRLVQSLSGVIQYAYQETPGPDGVTAFLFFPTFKVNEWINSSFEKPAYPANTPVLQILQDIATALELTLDAKFDPTLNVGPSGFNASGALKDVTLKLTTAYNLMFRLEANQLIVFDKGGTSIVHGINVLSSPPIKVAAGWSLVAPWDPAIRPGDEVWFDPAYARSTFGGYLISKSAQFIAISVELEFSTVSPENTMRLVLVEKAFFGTGEAK